MFDEEVGKYKKRSTGKGQPRSKHKHIYETVLLHEQYEWPDVKTGRGTVKQDHIAPTKVCKICGRVEYVDTDESYYVKNRIMNIPHLVFFQKDLSDKALSLPKWRRKPFDKFAYPMEEKDD